LKLILPLIFIDIFAIPMVHLGAIPFKFSFLYLLVWFLVKRPSVKLVLPLVGLIVALWLGKIFSFWRYELFHFEETIFMTVNYGVILVGYAFGLRSRLKDVNWLFGLIVVFISINLLIMLFWQSSTFLINFYNLQVRLEEGLFAYRNPGIFSNPNVSALASNLLILFWVLARQRGLITLKGFVYDAIVLLLGLIAAISFGSKSGFSAYAIILFSYLVISFRFSARRTILSIIVLLGLLIVINKSFMKSNIGSYTSGITTLVTFDDKIQREIFADHSRAGSRIFKIKHGFKMWLKAPLWGLGGDRTGSSSLQHIQYHNDWTEVLVSSGLAGFIMLILLVYQTSKQSLLFIVPFIFPGLTNSFFFTAQIAMAYFLFVGIITSHKNHSQELIPVNNNLPGVASLDNK
jgi:hypothetical protein